MNRGIRYFGCLALALTGSASAQDIDPTSGNAQPFPGTPVSGYQLAWSDEFNGSAVDTAKWNFRTGVRFWSTQQAQNNSVSNGLLNIHLKKETVGTTSYTAGGLISKKAVRYGYYEARMRVPPGRGWHTSFWMTTGGTPVPDTAIELDVVENDSITPLKYGVNTHRWKPDPHIAIGNKSVTTPSLHLDFHVFGCEFTPATIKYFFDGTLVQTVDATQFAHCDLNIWLTSIAAPLGGTTNVDDTQVPAVAEFDYARFFKPGPTVTINIVTPGAAGITLSNTDTRLRLTALATTSDPEVPPAVMWSKLSGPGDVTFSNPAATDTRAQFSATGSYLLQCQATVGTSVSTARIPVAVNAPLTATLRQGENGYSHTATFIRGDSVDWNSGARDQFIVGRWNNQGLRPLLSFDLSPLDSAAVIQSASLDLWTEPGTGSVGDVELHPMAATPVEGSGDGSSAAHGQGSGATWVARTGGTGPADLWTAGGGDFDPAVLSVIPGFDATVANAQKTFPSSGGFVAAAQAALNTGAPLSLIALSPATESGSGNFISRLGSDDSATLARRPQLTLTFLGNPAPVISADIAPQVTRGIPAALNGSVSHATGGTWSAPAGPGSVAFADAGEPGTTAVFSQPGDYLLQLTATNPLGETSRSFNVSVLSGIESWRQTHFGSRSGTDIAADQADPNFDGEVNLIEFATGQDPRAATLALPGFVKTGATLELTYTRSHAALADGINFAVEWSDDLETGWSDAGVTEESLGDDGTVRTVKASVAAGSAGRRFLHLRVIKP